VRTLLPHDKSWDDTEEYVSNGDWSSDIRIWKEDEGDVFDIVFRYSPGNDGWSLMQAFVRIAREERCVLLEHDSGEDQENAG
jgi:hypothetical protein